MRPISATTFDLITNHTLQKFHDMDFLLPILDRMKRQQPEQRPEIDDVISQWKILRAENMFMASWRCSPKSETMIERALNDTVAVALGGLKTLKKSFIS